MSVKSTIKYGSTTIVDQFEESSDTINVVYNGSTIQTFSAGDDKYLNTRNKVCTDYLQIGSKILNTKNKLLNDCIECIVENAREPWDTNPKTSAQATALGYTWTTQ